MLMPLSSSLVHSVPMGSDKKKRARKPRGKYATEEARREAWTRNGKNCKHLTLETRRLGRVNVLHCPCPKCGHEFSMAKGSVWVDSEGLQVHPTTQEDKPHVPHIPDDVEQEIDPTQPDQNDQVESRAAAGLFLSDVMIDEKCVPATEHPETRFHSDAVIVDAGHGSQQNGDVPYIVFCHIYIYINFVC